MSNLQNGIKKRKQGYFFMPSDQEKRAGFREMALGNNKMEANKMARRIKAKIREKFCESAGSTVTLDFVFNAWFSEHEENWAEATKNKYVIVYRSVLEKQFGKRFFSVLESPEFRKHIDQYPSLSQAQEALRISLQLEKFAKENGFSRPLLVGALRRKIVKPHYQAQFVSVEEVHKLADECPPSAAGLILALFYTGQRVGDLISLKKEAVQGNRMMVTEKKKKKQRTVLLCEVLMKKFAELYELYPNSQYVFPNEKQIDKDIPYPYTSFSTLWNRVREKTMPDKTYRIHDLRASFIARLIELGNTPLDIVSFTGHSFASFNRVFEFYRTNNLAIQEKVLRAMNKNKKSGE